jgi:CRP/FNR family cyclic AMP-dependent transcriptional regulator
MDLSLVLKCLHSTSSAWIYRSPSVFSVVQIAWKFISQGTFIRDSLRYQTSKTDRTTGKHCQFKTQDLKLKLLRVTPMSENDKKLKTPRRPQAFTQADRISMLSELEFSSHLSEPKLVEFAASSLVIEVRRRRFVYRAGEQADALYAIVKGRIKLCRIEAETEREAVIDILPQGSLFGDSALYSTAGRRENCAVAYESCTLLKIPAEQFKVAMANDHQLHDHTLRLIGHRLERAEQRLADFALNAIPARLDRLLADFSHRYGVRESEGVLIDIPLPHREIASIVGSTRESVTVRLNAMRREGTIEFVNRRILVKRPEWLLRPVTDASAVS